jgi:hypothetical protein
MSAHVNVHITNVPGRVHISVPQNTPVRVTALECICWLRPRKLGFTPGAILTCPEFGDIVGDASPLQLVEQLLNWSGSVSTGRRGEAATSKCHHHISMEPVLGFPNDSPAQLRQSLLLANIV